MSEIVYDTVENIIGNCHFLLIPQWFEEASSTNLGLCGKVSSLTPYQTTKF